MKCDKIRFNNNMYLTATVDVYNYKTNRDEKVKIGDRQLMDALEKALLSGNPELKEYASSFAPDILVFVDREKMLSMTEEEIRKEYF